jgi:hypothetical protein
LERPKLELSSDVREALREIRRDLERVEERVSRIMALPVPGEEEGEVSVSDCVSCLPDLEAEEGGGG